MYGHRSIVRIKRNPERDRSINICLILICYIIINLIFSDYWLYINSAIGLIIFFILLFFLFCKINDGEEDSEEDMGDIENNSFDSNISQPPIIAVPISPTGMNINEYTIQVDATII
jgi:hypothetical protein